MELRQLEYFVTVADELNFGRAAKRLHVTQPGVSQGIKVLEREFGIPLFERNRQHVVLTPAGATLLPAVQRLLGQVEEVGHLAARLANRHHRHLTLSHTRSAGVGLPSRLTAEFRRTYPHVSIETSVGFTSMNVERITTGEIDVAFVRPPINGGDDLGCLELAREPLVVAVPEEHRLVELRSVQPDDLRDEPLVFFPQQAGGLWTSVLDEVYGVGRHPEIVRVEPDEPHMLAAVAEGAGISLLTESAATILRIPGVVVRRFGEPITVPLGLAWRRDNKNEALRSFLSFVYETVGARPYLPAQFEGAALHATAGRE